MSVLKITKDNFEEEVMGAGCPVLIDFFAVWCGPCKMMAPIIEEIAEEESGVKVCQIDVDEEPELAQRFGVISIPTLIVIKEGKVAAQVVGVQRKNTLLEMLRR